MKLAGPSIKKVVEVLAWGLVLVCVAWGLTCVMGCAVKGVEKKTTQTTEQKPVVKPEIETGAVDGDVVTTTDTRTNVYNVAGSAGWLMVLPLLLLLKRGRTYGALVDRLTGGIDAAGSYVQIKNRIKEYGTWNGKPDAAEKLLRRRLAGTEVL